MGSGLHVALGLRETAARRRGRYTPRVVAHDLPNRIARFKSDLRAYSVDEVVQRHITYGTAFALDGEQYFELKSLIACKFGLHHSEVLMVGSGKLGFSIVESKRYRPFGDTSDLDIALISPALFDAIWLDAYEYWRAKSFWPEYAQFKEYLFRGWIRPDKLPPAHTFRRNSDWWEFFREVTASQRFGPYRIRAGLYRSWSFLEAYQTKCVAECRDAEGAA